MLMIKRRIGFLTMAEVFFSGAEPPDVDIQDCDLVRYYHAPEPQDGARTFHTLHIDLRLEEDVLLRNMQQETRKEIRRAPERDSLTFSMSTEPCSEEIQDYCEYYDRFAKAKSLPRGNHERLFMLRRESALALSTIRDADQTTLSWHSYAVDGARAYGISSASHLDFRWAADSPRRSLMGRANRYHYWMDIKTFKEMGLKTFDFGGLSGGRNPDQLAGIDAFKKGFGGIEVVEYDYYRGRSVQGKFAEHAIRRLPTGFVAAVATWQPRARLRNLYGRLFAPTTRLPDERV
jgi:hypothetical protein